MHSVTVKFVTGPAINHFLSFNPEADSPKSWQEQLPLIIGSATAGLVFIIAVVVIAIVCLRSESNASTNLTKMYRM